MKQEEKARLSDNWLYVKKVWIKESKNFKLTDWKLKLNNDIMCPVGICNYQQKSISISSVFLRGSNCTHMKAKKVLMHEIAHAITPGHSHDKIWKDKCRKIGGDDRLAVTINIPGMSWELSCKKCKWKSELPTKPNVVNKVCGKCKGKIFVRYIK